MSKSKVNPLLKKLYLAPTDTISSVSYENVGRFKTFINYFKEYMSKGLTSANLLTFLFFLPVFAVWGCTKFFGIEAIALYFTERSTNYYLLSGFGIGMSAGDSIAMAKASILEAYRYLSYIACALLPIGFIGLSGMFHITTKIVYKEPFSTKKNKFGGDSPRPILEYFKGIAKGWWKYLIAGVVLSGIFIGLLTLVFDLASAVALNTVTAGNIVGVVLGGILMLLIAMWTVLFLPMLRSYKINPIFNARNSGIFALSFFVPTFFILLITVGPIMLSFIGSIFDILIVFLFAFFGFSYICLAWTIYAELYSETFLSPLYQSVSINKGQKKEKKAGNAGSKTYVNPKKKKK